MNERPALARAAGPADGGAEPAEAAASCVALQPWRPPRARPAQPGALASQTSSLAARQGPPWTRSAQDLTTSPPGALPRRRAGRLTTPPVTPRRGNAESPQRALHPSSQERQPIWFRKSCQQTGGHGQSTLTGELVWKVDVQFRSLPSWFGRGVVLRGMVSPATSRRLRSEYSLCSHRSRLR